MKISSKIERGFFLLITAPIWLILLYILFILALWLSTCLTPMGSPKIKYAEFPFKLTYEVYGETRVIEDSIVCEYKGAKVVAPAGKRREWTSYLKSGNEKITLIDFRFDPSAHALEHNPIKDGVIEVKLYD